MGKRRTFSEMWMGYDAYERHQAMVHFLGADLRGEVLDVGGLANGLSQFLPETQVTALNIDGTGDMLYAGDVIPFDDCSFDVVVSLDTLEHVPKANREQFLHECSRVARRMLLLAAPYGTPGHSAYEASLDELYRTVHGDYHRWLHEHVINGLPFEEALGDYRQMLAEKGFDSATYYCGDYVWQCRRLERSLSLHRSLGPLRKLSAAYDLAAMAAPWPPPTFAPSAAETTNRFYLVAERK